MAAVPAWSADRERASLEVRLATVRGLSAAAHRARLGWRDLTDDERAEQLARNLDDVCPGDSWAEKDCAP